jgi:hypothetical protein
MSRRVNQTCKTGNEKFDGIETGAGERPAVYHERPGGGEIDGLALAQVGL